MKQLTDWSISSDGSLSNQVYSIQHGSSQTQSENWSRICFQGRYVNEIFGRDALLRNILEVERRISTEEDFIINGYNLYHVEEDAIYVAKSIDEVLDYCKDAYGDIEEIYDCNESEFHTLVARYNLCEPNIHKLRSLLNEDEGKHEEFSYYQFYKDVAQKDEGCVPVIFFNI